MTRSQSVNDCRRFRAATPATHTKSARRALKTASLVLFTILIHQGVFAAARPAPAAKAWPGDQPHDRSSTATTSPDDQSASAAQDSSARPPASKEVESDQHDSAQPDDPPSMFNHSHMSRFWVSGQVNIIFQYNPAFSAKYSGAQSFGPRAEHATSRVLTLFTGLRLTKTTEALVDIEETGGGGLSQAFGLAGFTNLDVVRNPTLSKGPYLARAMLHQIIPLSDHWDESTPGPFSLFPSLPSRRLEIRVGKYGMVDFFDVNEVGNDSHLQFMNWTVDDNGAYDYAADTRGYTWGAIIEYDQPGLAVRFAEGLMPKVANGINLDWDLARARGENLEAEIHYRGLAHRPGVLRLLAYANHAHMGTYRQAIADFLAGPSQAPDITETERQGRVKYGFLAGAEQELPHDFRVFARAGWNEGHHESFAYTEVDNTFAFGGDLAGVKWHRREDKAGLAFSTNGLSRDHARYLALGGSGFLLGDGALTYGRETIEEAYYNVHLWRGVFAAADLQHINNPGYNKDRGPVFVGGLRLHLEF